MTLFEILSLQMKVTNQIIVNRDAPNLSQESIIKLRVMNMMIIVEFMKIKIKLNKIVVIRFRQNSQAKDAIFQKTKELVIDSIRYSKTCETIAHQPSTVPKCPLHLCKARPLSRVYIQKQRNNIMLRR